MKTPFFFLFLIVLGSCARFAEKPVKVLLVGGGNSASEAAAWEDYNAGEDWESTVVDWSAVVQTDLQAYDVVWIHQLDTILSAQAMEAGEMLLAYAKKGGKVLLSMEAMRLLHPWGLEPAALEVRRDSIFDEGFGRPLGFHGFKDHVIYDQLHGGVYPWKSPENHWIRKTGFFGKALPQHPDAKVLGIEWTYITFHDSTKLVVEYPLGEGSLLGVGAYTYFGAENYNRPELEQFYHNVIQYLGGQLQGVENYWNYAPATVMEKERVLPDISNPAFESWELPDLSIWEASDVPGDAFVSLAGRRLLIMGKERGGIDEIWSHPFMAARDLKTGLLMEGQLQWLDELPSRLIVSPEMLIREYRIGAHMLREITTLSFDRPIGVLHYEIPPDLPFEGLVFEAFFNARYMWPYDASATGSMVYHFDREKQGLLVTAQDETLVSWLQFSAAPRKKNLGPFEGFSYSAGGMAEGNPADHLQLGSSFVFDAADLDGGLEILLAAGSEGTTSLWNQLRSLGGQTAGLFEGTHAYYQQLLKEKLFIHSPDSLFNKGYAWALARTDQFFQTTPGLGTTQMAGFGTTARGWDGRHAVSGRPGYAWYFGRDAEWSGMAVNAYGDFDWVKEMLKVFVRYQALNGKIFHELSTSGAVHYDASDATPLFVVLAAHYLKYSNDLEFIREIWPNLKLAMDFCAATDTDGDGLIENTDVGHGWIEGGALFGVHTEFYLAGAWAAALEGAGYMADLLEEPSLSASYRKEALRVKAIIDREFWSPNNAYFYNGKLRDGSFQEQASVLQAVPIYLDAVTDSLKAIQSLAPFAGQQWTTDWGIRMIPADNPVFNPRSYHAGMVWPLYGGWASLAEYKTGYYHSAWFHVRANLLNYLYWGKGSVEETLHGQYFQPAGVCSQQCWSESMVLQPLIEGMLGLEPDAPRKKLSLSPRFPTDWDQARVSNIRMANMALQLDWKRGTGVTEVEIWRDDDSEDILELQLSQSFALGTNMQSVTIDGIKANWKSLARPESVDIVLESIPLPKGQRKKLVFNHSGGIAATVPLTLPEPGKESQGLRILRQELTPEGLSLRVEGRSGVAYTLDVYSPEGLSEGTGYVVMPGDEPSWYQVALRLPEGAGQFIAKEVVLRGGSRKRE